MSPKPKETRQKAGFETSRWGDRRWLDFAVPWSSPAPRALKGLLAAGVLLGLATWGLDSQAQTNSATVQTNTGGIAVSIVYDGSGSMADKVPGADHQPTPKYRIANKAIGSIVRQLVAFSQDKHVEVQAGLVYFVAGKIHQAIPLTGLTPASAASFMDWAGNFTTPSGGTPLGLAIREAQHQLDPSHCSHKHILVITDGVSNSGISPDRVVHAIRASPNPIPVYFVAFDINASVFDPVKAQGASVVSASDEAQLNVEINHLLGQKILLEAE
jgi:hypothetical protein